MKTTFDGEVRWGAWERWKSRLEQRPDGTWLNPEGVDDESFFVPVAVKRRPDKMPISKGERSGAVPRLHAVGVVVHELGDLFKLRRRHEHADCLAYTAAVAGQQFDGFVEAR